MPPISRRSFLIGTGALTAGAGLPGLTGCLRWPGESSRRVDNVRLVVGWLDTRIDGTNVRLRTYNGKLPGPLITTRPGHTVRVYVNNQLGAYDSSEWNGDHNVPHHLNTTNLHLHGLEIAPHLFDPVGTAEESAPMIAIAPGESFVYSFDVPDDQPSGLFWYHPHHHGSTAVQAVNGMAGALIVRGPIDEVPEIAAAREIVIAVQDIGLFPGQKQNDPWMYDPPQNAIWQTFGGYVTKLGPDGEKVKQPELTSGFSTGDYPLRYFLANGQPFFKETHNRNQDKQREPTGTQLEPPVFRLRPGEVAWIRMLNGTSDDLMPLVVEGHAMHLIALDGVNFLEPEVVAAPQANNTQPQLSLAPANRGEFLIRASRTPGVYNIRQLEQEQQFLRSDARIVARLVVEGEPVKMALPRKLPTPTRHYPLIADNEIVARHEVVFTGTVPGVKNPVVGIDFEINSKLYDEKLIDHTVKLGTAEEWTLRVPDDKHGGTEGHPFHIHVNSFEVVEIDGKPQNPVRIMDTVWVPTGSTIKIRSRFRQWTGKSVYHCHILPHEDTGMMQNVLIAG